MAAGTVKGITIEIEGKTSGLVKSLGNVNKALNQTQQSLKTVEKALKLDPKNVDALKTKQNLLNQAIQETEEKLELEKKAATDAAEALEKGTITKNQYDTLQAEVAKTSSELQNLKKSAKETNDQLKSVGGDSKLKNFTDQLEKAQKKLKDLGTSLTKTGKNLTKYVTAPIAAVGTIAVKTAADFDASMSKVQAVSGATADDMEKLRSKAREMGENTKFSASEAAEAMNYMAMAGWKTEDMLSGISGIMDLAAASGEDLGTTSDIVTDALTAFGLEAKDAGHFADILAAASSNANTNVSMMGESFKYVAPVAGAMGYSAEDVSIALGLMANSGIKASQAGTSLRTILTNMASPTDKMADAMEKLGVRLDDGNGNMRSFRDIMKDLRKGFGDLKMPVADFEKKMELLDEQLEDGIITEKQYNEETDELTKQAFGAEGALKAEAAASLAGNRGMSALLAIVQASPEEFDKLTTAIDGSNGAASNMAEIMQDNLEGRVTKMKSKLQELGIQIGEKLIPIIEKVVDWISSLIDWFSGLDDTTQTIIITILGLSAVLGPLITVIGSIISGVSGVIGVVKSVTTAIGGAGGLSAVLSSTIAGPLAAVVLSITAIIAVIENWEDIMEVLEWVWESVCEGIKDLIQGLANVWNDVVDSIVDGIENITGAIAEANAEAARQEALADKAYASQATIRRNVEMYHSAYGITGQKSFAGSNSQAAIQYERAQSATNARNQSNSSHYTNIYVGSGSASKVVSDSGRANNKAGGGR